MENTRSLTGIDDPQTGLWEMLAWPISAVDWFTSVCFWLVLWATILVGIRVFLFMPPIRKRLSPRLRPLLTAAVGALVCCVPLWLVMAYVLA